MKTFLLLLMSCTACLASPFLTCNPYPPVASGGDPKTAIASFNLFFDGATTPVNTPAVIDATGNQNLHYDVSGLTAASHTVTAAAVNQYGVSSLQSAPFVFNLTPPAAPSGLMIEPK